MEFVNFRTENDQLVMVLNEEADFQVLLNAIQDRLTLFKEKQHNHPKSMKIDIGCRTIKPSELLELFDLVINLGVTIIEGIKAILRREVEIEVFEGTLRGGQTAFYDNSVMILGDINPGSVLTARYNVYVVGSVRGKIVIKSEFGRVIASSYKNCIIQIFDAEPVMIENLEGNVIDYQDGIISINQSPSKGGNNYGKNNSCYVR